MQKKVPRYRQKIQIFKSMKVPVQKKYRDTIVLGTAHLCSKCGILIKKV